MLTVHVPVAHRIGDDGVCLHEMYSLAGKAWQGVAVNSSQQWHIGPVESLFKASPQRGGLAGEERAETQQASSSI